MKHLILILLLFCLKNTYAQTMTSLDVLTSQRANWQNDYVEVAYVALRCAVLENILGGYMNQSSNPDHKALGQNALIMAKKLSELSALATIKQPKYDLNTLKQQHEVISRDYLDAMSKNQKLNNSVFTETVRSDHNFCYKFGESLQ